ncbi:MAG: PepSY domain-containing protein [Eubacterium sp.]
MKRNGKKTLKAILVFGLIAALLMGGSMTAFAAKTSISKTKAKTIALQRAKVKSSDVKKWVEVKLDNYDGDKDREWEVEFTTATYKYEVEINARTGKVEGFEKEKPKKKAASKTPAKQTTASQTKYIGSAKAKTIALEHAKNRRK